MDKLTRTFFVLSVLTLHLYAFGLKEGIEEVLGKDPEIKEYESRQKELSHEVSIAKGNYFPTLNLQSDTEYLQNQYGSFDESMTQSVILELKQNLFNGFADSNKIKLESARERSAFYRLNEKKNSIALSFITNYLNVLKQKDLLTVAKMSLDYHKTMYQKIEKKVNAGVGRQLELRHSRTSLDLAQLTYQVNQRNLEQEEIGFSRLLQRLIKSDTLETNNLQLCLDDTLESYVKKALQKHPAVLVAQKNKQVAEFEYAYAKRYYFPTIDVSTNYNYNQELALSQNQNSYDINFQVTYNLFNGLKDRQEELKQIQRLKQNGYAFERQKRDVLNRLSLTWSSYQKNYNNYEIVLLNTVSKKDTLYSYDYEFLLGRASLNAMLDATQSYYASLKEMTSSYYELLVEQYKILEATGILVSYLQKPDTLFQCNRKKIPYVLSNSMAMEDNQTASLRLDQNCYHVTANKLWIRMKKDAKSPKNGFLFRGMRVCSQIKSSGWVKVEKGWISMDFLKPVRPVSLDLDKMTSTPNESIVFKRAAPIVKTTFENEIYTFSTPQCYQVMSGMLNIRMKPESTAKIIGTKTRWDEFCSSKSHGKWLQLGRGWVHRAYVKVIDKKE